MRNRARIALSAGDTPPREFRIFTAGWNDTTKGRYLFDDKAAKLVMGAYQEQGIDRSIDLEHLSLNKESASYDPDSRGWCKLELRNGELWAVNVAWTEDGDERLRTKKQRYISPVFEFDKETSRITALYNIAICAVPATHETPALVAASQHAGKKYGTLSIEVKKMEELKKIAVALGLKEDATLEEVLAAIKALSEEEEAADDPPKKKDGDEEEAADDPPKDKDKEEMSAIAKLPPALQGKVMAALAAVPTLTKEIAAIRAKQSKSEIEQLVAANTTKIPKALEQWALGTTVEVLTAFLKNAPETSAPKTPKEQTTTETVALTDADRVSAKLAGFTPEQVLAHKKKMHDERLEQERIRRG